VAARRPHRRHHRPGQATLASAKAFGERIAARLELPPSLLLTAYEDVPRLIDSEAELPVNADPMQADLADPGERARLARLLRGGLGAPTGFVLPLRAAESAGGGIAGSRAPGRCAAGTCSRSAATRRSAFACRSARSPTCCPRSRSRSSRSILSRRAMRCPSAATSALRKDACAAASRAR
jgi:hypothetical protein